MKTICVKNNNENILEYLFKETNKLDINDTAVSCREFKNYNNIIIHYFGKNENKFLETVSEIISMCIEIFFEKKILKKIIDENYFYFEDFEKDIILRICEKIIELQETNEKYKNEILKKLIFEYFSENKYMILEGFVIFRIKEYFDILNYIVDISVSNFVVNFR